MVPWRNTRRKTKKWNTQIFLPVVLALIVCFWKVPVRKLVLSLTFLVKLLKHSLDFQYTTLSFSSSFHFDALMVSISDLLGLLIMPSFIHCLAFSFFLSFSLSCSFRCNFWVLKVTMDSLCPSFLGFFFLYSFVHSKILIILLKPFTRLRFSRKITWIWKETSRSSCTHIQTRMLLMINNGGLLASMGVKGTSLRIFDRVTS